MSDATKAVATGAAGRGITGIMWSIDHTLEKPPEGLVALTIIISVISISISLILWTKLAISKVRAWLSLLLRNTKGRRVPNFVSNKNESRICDAAQLAGGSAVKDVAVD
jgi:hypothetical protein